jgi:acyl-CoA dehydrogenase
MSVEQFEETEAQQALRAEIRSLVEGELQPLDGEIERTGVVPLRAIDAMRAAGLYGLNTPVEFGGRGYDMTATCVAVEELARAHIAFYYLSGVNVHIGSRPILLHGRPDQQRRWLPDIARGAVSSAFALTEPGAGSDAAALTTTALRDGRRWVLDGEKCYITDAPISQLFIVFATVEPGARRRGITAFLVPSDTPGVSVGEPTEMMAGRGSSHASVHLRGAVVDDDAVVGEVGQGYEIALRSLDAGRTIWAAYCVGVMRRLLELCVAHATTRHTFGRPLAGHQDVEFAIADIAASLHVAALVSKEAAWSYDHGTDEARVLSAARAKLVNAKLAWEVADRALQLHGGAGYSRDLPIERIFREVRVVQILDGTSQMMRRIVGRAALATDGPPRPR